jgi:hypothetical protein
VENFIVAALLDWWEHHERGNWRDRVDLGALESHDAAAVVGAEVIFLAGAAGSADAWAHGVGVFARSIATFALTEFFVVAAGLGWRHGDFHGFLVAFAGHDATAVVADVSFFAGAAGHADARADGVGLLACSIATFALAVFFVVAADGWWHGEGFGSGYAAQFRVYAHALFVFQVTGLAEAADYALEGARDAGMGFGAGRGAGRAARHEHLVFFALRNFRRVGEEHGGFRGFALAGLHADTVGVSQMAFLAEASNDAVLGADGARMGFGAGRGAGGAAGLEFFVVGAFRGAVGHGELHGDFVVGSGIAFVREHAFAHRVLQVSLLTETADDALEGTHFGFFRMGAIGDAGGSARLEFLIRTALGFFGSHGKSRSGDSSAEGANAEQQQKSKAKGHR